MQRFSCWLRFSRQPQARAGVTECWSWNVKRCRSCLDQVRLFSEKLQNWYPEISGNWHLLISGPGKIVNSSNELMVRGEIWLKTFWFSSAQCRDSTEASWWPHKNQWPRGPRLLSAAWSAADKAAAVQASELNEAFSTIKLAAMTVSRWVPLSHQTYKSPTKS